MKLHIIVILGLALIGASPGFAQTVPSNQPVATQPQIPTPEPITIDSIKVSLADAVLSRENAYAYVQKLQAKIVELSAELQKLKDEFAKSTATPEPVKTEAPKVEK